MSQLSLFSADARPAGLADLAGLLCGPGHIVRFGVGDQARLSIEPPDGTRAPAVVAACAAVGITAHAVVTENGAVSVRTAFRCDLVGLARSWLGPGRAGSDTKSVPSDWQLDGAALRMWALSAGRPDARGGYLLALDPGAPQTHDALVGAATRAGIPPARVGGEPTGPALRISGTRRVQRLVELVGPVPVKVPAEDWPRYWGRSAS